MKTAGALAAAALALATANGAWAHHHGGMFRAHKAASAQGAAQGAAKPAALAAPANRERPPARQPAAPALRR